MREKVVIDSSVLVKVLLENILEDLTSTIIMVLYIDEKILHLSKRISFEYKLLPNDSLIAATCKHHDINKIATFDPDFKRVDFLEIITQE